MKYSIDMSSKDPADWKLLRYGEPAGSKLPNPGAFDNAHLGFWQEIESLRENLATLEALNRRLDAVRLAAEEAASQAGKDWLQEQLRLGKVLLDNGFAKDNTSIQRIKIRDGRWIDLADEYPHVGQLCLVKIRGVVQNIILEFDGSDDGYFWADPQEACDSFSADLTHQWRPLPV